MTNTNPSTELLTVAEVAAGLRISAMTVRRHIASGALRAVRVGRQWRVSRDALKALETLAR